MVEKFRTVGMWLGLYVPFRKFGARMTDWIDTALATPVWESGYPIMIELPAVVANRHGRQGGKRGGHVE